MRQYPPRNLSGNLTLCTCKMRRAQWVQHSSYGMYQYFIKVCPILWLIRTSVDFFCAASIALFSFNSSTCSMTEVWVIIFFSFPGCSHCLHWHKWSHHPLKSGNFFLFSLVWISILMIADAHICICMILKCSLRCCYSLPQFSVTEHFRSSESGRIQALPGVFFFYDLSPIKVPI